MTLNNQKTWILLDTGSGLTVLDTKVKDKYGFITSGDSRLRVSGFGSDENQLHRAFKAKIQFGDVHLRGVIYAFDISTVAQSIRRRTGKRIAGIIGTNMMRTYGFVIDMGNGRAVMPVKC